ncbi:hypothetical protein N7466_010899 [Penicillium verhagenii]|uniref:uncharacterized protein n=1 Tax=Penicillium verhagenii TaxID=1562060 RepID=UPI0025452E07|nr:uncharacterized protein N7466_010899 [Penicillium verhagenii]KAJ5917345.1 hypothetical protein N7466_010899 [Penicillium verhagenii]
MAAPRIPNLNSLRRGQGRGRGGLRGLGDNDTRPTGKDRVVQGTDNDASVSRLSAVELGYLNDPYVTALTAPGNATRRFPIINRGEWRVSPKTKPAPSGTNMSSPIGTYVRTTAIDQLVTQFLGPYSPDAPQNKKQIISLGAGSDTRVFRLLASRQPSDLIYHELDFAVNTTTKIHAIRSTPSLQKALGIDSSSQDVTVSEAGDALHSPFYHIHPLDLRALSSSSSPTEMIPGVDTSLPTLLISECCLIYLSPTEAESVVSFFTERLFGPTSSLGLILYEPIRPDDAFGQTMVWNLASRGIQLKTLSKYATLKAQRTRLHGHGFGSGQAVADIEFLWERWVSEGEKNRVSRLEMLDEVEEWQLLARHYCIAWGWRDAVDAAFNGWTTLQAQPGDV